MEENKRPEDFYSKIIVHKMRRGGFYSVSATVLFLCTVLINTNYIQGGHWLNVALPIILVSVPVLVYPPIEEWQYIPWQAKAQKIEIHYTEE